MADGFLNTLWMSLALESSVRSNSSHPNWVGGRYKVVHTNFIDTPARANQDSKPTRVSYSKRHNKRIIELSSFIFIHDHTFSVYRRYHTFFSSFDKTLINQKQLWKVLGDLFIVFFHTKFS